MTILTQSVQPPSHADSSPAEAPRADGSHTDWGPPPGQMRASHLNGFFRLMQQCGGDARALLKEYGINPTTIADPENYVDCTSTVALLERCGIEFHDPLFGARLARTQSADIFGCVAALGRAAPTFREGVQCFVDYLPVMHSREGSVELVSARQRAELRWTGDGLFATNLQGNIHSLVLQMKILQMLGGADFRPDYVLVCAEIAPADLDELENWLGCRIDIRQEHNAIGFPTQVLDWPILTSNRMLYKLIRDHIEGIKQATTPSLQDRVLAYIRSALPTGYCSLARCAEAQGMSRRMLQWQLEGLGLSFANMVEKERMVRAHALLTDSRLPIVEIAGMLGYSEQSSFGRASRRWFGVPPRALRQTLS